MASHENRGISNHRQLDYIFSSLFIWSASATRKHQSSALQTLCKAEIVPMLSHSKQIIPLHTLWNKFRSTIANTHFDNKNAMCSYIWFPTKLYLLDNDRCRLKRNGTANFILLLSSGFRLTKLQHTIPRRCGSYVCSIRDRELIIFTSIHGPTCNPPIKLPRNVSESDKVDIYVHGLAFVINCV